VSEEAMMCVCLYTTEGDLCIRRRGAGECCLVGAGGGSNQVPGR
jgi:hypothetical protein